MLSDDLFLSRRVHLCQANSFSSVSFIDKYKMWLLCRTNSVIFEIGSHGNTPEEVLRDEEGLQTVRVLAQNMTWLLRCIEAGKAAGVKYPEYEPKLRTNFIR